MLLQRALIFPLSEWRVSCCNSCGIKKFWVTQTWIQICALLLLSWVTLGNLLSLNHNFLTYIIRDSNHFAGLLWSMNWIIYLKIHSTGSVNVSTPHLLVLVICVNLWFLISLYMPQDLALHLSLYSPSANATGTQMSKSWYDTCGRKPSGHGLPRISIFLALAAVWAGICT